LVDVEVSHTAGDGGRWCHGPCQAPPPGRLRYTVPAGTRLILDILSTNRPSPHGLVDGWALEEDATSDATEHAGGVGAVGLSCLVLACGALVRADLGADRQRACRSGTAPVESWHGYAGCCCLLVAFTRCKLHRYGAQHGLVTVLGNLLRDWKLELADGGGFEKWLQAYSGNFHADLCNCLFGEDLEVEVSNR
jgi:hypothetical protein